MARRRTAPKELPDAVRDAVERTMQATMGSAERTREAVDELVRGAESRGRAVRHAFGGALPATQDDVRELKAELRRIARRLDAIEDRLPARGGRSQGARKKA